MNFGHGQNSTLSERRRFGLDASKCMHLKVHLVQKLVQSTLPGDGLEVYSGQIFGPGRG